MSSLEQILTNASSGMSAESYRMNIIASNLANASSSSGTESDTYRTKTAIMSEIKDPISGISSEDQPIGGVRVTDIQNSTTPLQKKYDPQNPQANSDGYVFMSDVNPLEQMTNMIEASKQYAGNVEVMNTTKGLIMQTVSLLK